MFKIFFEIEKLRKEALKLYDRAQKAEERNEGLYKALVLSEEECMRLQNENDRLQAKLKVNEKILKAVGK